MAINPNTDFTAGQVLTAAQQNRFPRGVMALATSLTNQNITTEALTTGMSVTFTAVADRYYRVTYYENAPFKATTATGATFRVRQTNLAGALIVATNVYFAATGQNTAAMSSIVTTFTAGSITLVGTAEIPSGTLTLERNGFSQTRVGAYLLVEDIGAA